MAQRPIPALDAVICRSCKDGQLATRKSFSEAAPVVPCTYWISSVCVGALIKR
jgi:hypothetical protein